MSYAIESIFDDELYEYRSGTLCEALERCARSGVRLDSARLCRADLGEARLRGAHLRGANLREATLRRADLRGADLLYANLRDADLGGARLEGADLKHARLEGANLVAANITGADISPDALVAANLHGAIGAEALLAEFRDDLWALLDKYKGEVQDLAAIMHAGKMGMMGDGRIVDLTGSIGKRRDDECGASRIRFDGHSRAMDWICLTTIGSTPASRLASDLALEWIQQWQAKRVNAVTS